MDFETGEGGLLRTAVLADYDDWRIDDFLVQADTKLYLGAFADPVVRSITSHDETEGTQLAQALEACLRCANNAQTAARLPGIHKNTTCARLERIQQLFGVDLESGEVAPPPARRRGQCQRQSSKSTRTCRIASRVLTDWSAQRTARNQGT